MEVSDMKKLLFMKFLFLVLICVLVGCSNNPKMAEQYIPVGTYEADDDNLILKTDDGKYKYVFKIKDNTLIFSAKESSEIPSFANVPDGAIFK
jgi:hypothetical protein